MVNKKREPRPHARTRSRANSSLLIPGLPRDYDMSQIDASSSHSASRIPQGNNNFYDNHSQQEKESPKRRPNTNRRTLSLIMPSIYFLFFRHQFIYSNRCTPFTHEKVTYPVLRQCW